MAPIARGVLALSLLLLSAAGFAANPEVIASDELDSAAAEATIEQAPSVLRRKSLMQPAERQASGVLQPEYGSEVSDLAGPLSHTPETVEATREDAPVGPAARRLYLNLESLLWWAKGDHLPPLVTTSPIGTPFDKIGVLGEPTTGILFGDEPTNNELMGGGRVRGGYWLNERRSVALEGHYYGLGTATSFDAVSTFTNGSTKDRILARPFFDSSPSANRQTALVIAAPASFDGSIEISDLSLVQSAGAGMRIAIGQLDRPRRWYLLGAYRYFNLQEKLTLLTNSMSLIFLQIQEQFETHNAFNGGELGLATEMVRNRWSFNAEARLAMGNMHQTLEMNANTWVIIDGAMGSGAGGLLIAEDEIGSYSRDRFALIPQLDLQLGYQVLPSLRLIVGYNYTYITNLLRPGQQINLNVPLTQASARSQVTLEDSGMWLQGITLGLDLSF